MSGWATAHDHGARAKYSWIWTILGPWDAQNMGMWGIKLILVTS